MRTGKVCDDVTTDKDSKPWTYRLCADRLPEILINTCKESDASLIAICALEQKLWWDYRSDKYKSIQKLRQLLDDCLLISYIRSDECIQWNRQLLSYLWHLKKDKRNLK